VAVAEVLGLGVGEDAAAARTSITTAVAAVGAVVDLDRQAHAPGGDGDDVDALGAGLREEATLRDAHEVGVEALLAGDHLGVGEHGVAHPTGGGGQRFGEALGRAHARDRAGHREEGDRQGGSAAAVDAGLDAVDGQAGEGRDVAEDRALHGVLELEVAVEGIAAVLRGGEHARVLAGAVGEDGRHGDAVATLGEGDVAVDRAMAAAAERVLGDACLREDRARRRRGGARRCGCRRRGPARRG
jgi:hypothetical protein